MSLITGVLCVGGGFSHWHLWLPERLVLVFHGRLNFFCLVWTGAYDDPNGSHISIVVVSDAFEGKRPVQRQQLVYKAIWEEVSKENRKKVLRFFVLDSNSFIFNPFPSQLQGPVHAVDAMICKTPGEA